MKVRRLLQLLAVTLLVFVASAAFCSDEKTITESQIERTAVAQWEYMSTGTDEESAFDEVWDSEGNVIEGDENDIVARVDDPLEGWNRFWFRFNDRAYYYVFKPVTEAYKWFMPEKPRSWVRNFFNNLLFPVRFVNCVLQGKLFEAGVEASRFIGNTAFGLGGLSDFANDLKPTREISSTDEDLGQTLGAWGMDNGPYLVWPILGPSSLRDTAGHVGDYFLTPTSYIHPWYWSVATVSYEQINNLSFRLGEYETIKEGALDPYIALKSAYLRLREKKVND